MYNLAQILESLLSTDNPEGNLTNVYSSLQKIANAINCNEKECIRAIRIGQDTDQDADSFLDCLKRKVQSPKMHSFLSYFTDEIICNIQQHANVSIAYGFVYVDKISNHLFVGLADGGRTIYGSFVNTQKFLDEIGDNESKSLILAQHGYSTKNLPNAENRGFGISTNTKIIVEELSGTLAILSGNAFSFKNPNLFKCVKLPCEIEWPGTLIIAEIPITDKTINLYKYISKP